jgi:hypothetical protein
MTKNSTIGSTTVMKIKIAEGELDLNSAVNCGRK